MKISQHPQIIPSTQDLLHGILNQKNLSKYLSKTKSHDEIKIVYFGTPEFSAYILEKLVEFCQNSSSHPRGGLEVQTVVTSPTPSPVSIVAQKYNIPTLKSIKLNDDFVKNHMFLLESDLFIVISYGQILPPALLDVPKLGAINVHPSLLPKYRGASPIQQAILNGDKETGITIIKMDERFDHGPIMATRRISISDQDTFESLSNKLMQLGAELLIETLPKFVEGKIRPSRQNNAKAVFCQKLTKESGYFDISNPPSHEKLDRMMRAYFPWPGVWTKWKGKIVKFLPDNMLQMEGKKAISYKDFLNGYLDFPIKSITLDKK